MAFFNDGAESAAPASGLIAALADPLPRGIVVAPSNPILSISPILAVFTVAVLRIQTVDARSTEPVAESWFEGYFRDMKAPAPRFALPPPAIDPPGTTEPIACDTIAILRGRSHVYNECARLRNPIHTGMAFAMSLGFPDIALHGTLPWAKMGEIAIDRHDRNPENLRRLAVQFRRPIFPNRTMSVETRATRAHPANVSIRLRDAGSNEVLSNGLALFGAVVVNSRSSRA